MTRQQAIERLKQTLAEALAQFEVDLTTAAVRNRSGPKGGRPAATFAREQVPLLREQGASWREIARELGVGVTTVRRAYRTDRDRR